MNDSKTHNMRLAERPFELITSGRKTVEVRLFDEKRQKLAVGDYIEFSLNGDEKRVVTRVVGLRRFGTFAELYGSELFSKCGCDSMTAAQAVEYIYSYYTKYDEEKYGALAIEIEVI